MDIAQYGRGTNLQVPEEEGEDEAHANAHPPGDEQEGHAAHVLQLVEHHRPLGDLHHCVGEHPTLRKVIFMRGSSEPEPLYGPTVAQCS